MSEKPPDTTRAARAADGETLDSADGETAGPTDDRSAGPADDETVHPADDERVALDELSFYSLGKGDREFIHQHVVDAWGAQTATEDGKPILLTMTLAGLYLHCERGFTGRQVQQAHMHIAKRGPPWPRFPLPEDRGSVRVGDVLAAPPGPERDEAIHAWARAVWDAFEQSHGRVREQVREWLDIEPPA